MSELTTAARLGAYRTELCKAGFTPSEVADLISTAAPHDLDTVQLQADLDAKPSSVATVTIDMVPRINTASIAKAAEHIRFALGAEAQETEGSQRS